MDNKIIKDNNQQSTLNPNKNTNTEVLNTREERKKIEEKLLAARREIKKENGVTGSDKAVKKETDGKAEEKRNQIQQKNEKPDNQKVITQQKNEKVADSRVKSDNTKDREPKRGDDQKEIIKKDEPKRMAVRKETPSEQVRGKTSVDSSSGHMKKTVMNVAKILLPVSACAIVIAVVISYIGSRKIQAVDNQSLNVSNHADTAGIAALSDEPLAENAYENVNELMKSFCTAMADGDMDTVKEIKDYNTDKEIITYREKSEFIEKYDNINCYTKPGIEGNSYFVYVTYDVKFKDIETQAPGLNAFYVYTAEDGNLRIDGDTEESTRAAFKLVTSQDDVVDLYNRINVSYNEAISSDEALNQFMEELPTTIRESVGVALAQLESGEAPQTEDDSTEAGVPVENEEPLQNQVVNQIVRTTDTVNVRSSDSEEADRIGKAQEGTELKRIEEKINGWSKVIFEGREAYIKSDYLEVVTTGVTTESTETVTATTNVNVRSQASQDSERLGSAQEGNSYNLLEVQGEWYKIDYNGTIGYVKAEFFSK